ncbi:hypothetical protein L198_02275 [Cryptococcus wingfieldii CBS 7118]|uniref:RRM domain-containing protein n=1 Tax=Cryptococcus wingfieldii CBS 7118 TaxID=1295528 RepID=A0A1E3JRB8_9TREE|nr:hypothetical protein L198_02275 [Cryptococcus wingfieldii CBS 7118]ODO03428.1 hypothetical protein L198_02275 [Cryptococcus wingfieldii CBS 7118]
MHIPFPSIKDRPPSPQLPHPPAGPRPHPFLLEPTVYVNSYPADLPDSVIFECLGRCPVKIDLPPAVPLTHRLMPDAYYDWMTRSGTLQFETLADAEKALAILHLHPFLVHRGVWVSPLPPAQRLPISPTPAARIFRPSQRMTDALSDDTIPTLADIYDALRPWGSLKAVSIWITDTESSDAASWFAKAEFWYYNEAEVFERDFGRKGWQIKGWQMYIFTPGEPYQEPSSFPSMLPSPPTELLSSFPLSPQSYHPGPLPPASSHHSSVAPVQVPPPLPAYFMPPTPPGGPAHLPDPTPPWASHNPYAYRPSPPITPNSKSSAMSRSASLGSPSGPKSRRWSLTVGETADGSVQPTGLISDDGTFIQHGKYYSCPGQHIRPAPAFGPGSQSASGLVDYSNVFIKNIDADVNSYFLNKVFSEFGVVVSAKIMRDEAQRSRGYGFVSFESPEQGNAMNNKPFGRQTLCVTLHEPRKLRPDKIAERAALGQSTRSFSNPTTAPSSVSPTRAGERRSSFTSHLIQSTSSPPPGAYPEPTDDIRLLSPADRATALHRRLSARIRQYTKKCQVESKWVESVVERLMPMDLALVPLLYNRWEMDEKIKEALAAVQEEAGSERDEGERPTEKDVVKLREELGMIDPEHAEELAKIILEKEMVTKDEWEKGWVESKAGVAIKYGEAKRFLVTERETEILEEHVEEDGEKKVEPEPMPLEQLTIDELARLPCSQISAYLASPPHLAHLSLSPPSSEQETSLRAWYAKVAQRGRFAARGEVVGYLSRQCVYGQVPGLVGSKSQKLKMLGELANAEADDEGLVKLTLYPAVLFAKLGTFIKARSAVASPTLMTIHDD